MVLAEDCTMSRTDEVHRVTENVYKVRCCFMNKVCALLLPVKHLSLFAQYVAYIPSNQFGMLSSHLVKCLTTWQLIN